MATQIFFSIVHAYLGKMNPCWLTFFQAPTGIHLYHELFFRHSCIDTHSIHMEHLSNDFFLRIPMMFRYNLDLWCLDYPGSSRQPDGKKKTEVVWSIFVGFYVKDETIYGEMPAFYYVILSCCFFVLVFFNEAEDSDRGCKFMIYRVYESMDLNMCVSSLLKKLGFV